MTMTRNPLLKVSESEVGVSHVPAFEVFSEEIVAFAVRGGMYEEWIRFFRKVLDDDRGNTAILDPLEIYRPATHRRLPDTLSKRGLTRDQVSEIISAVGLQPDRIYSSLKLTDRVLIELHVFLQRGVNLALVATGGLDPLGIQRVLNEAVKIKPQCSSVIMFYADFMRLHEPLELFNKVIEVS
jgi:hypothetical protein